MKLFLIASVARQVDGEYVVIKAEKAYLKATKADAEMAKLAKRYTEIIPGPHGPIECICERGVLEIEVDESE